MTLVAPKFSGVVVLLPFFATYIILYNFHQVSSMTQQNIYIVVMCKAGVFMSIETVLPIKCVPRDSGGNIA